MNNSVIKQALIENHHYAHLLKLLTLVYLLLTLVGIQFDPQVALAVFGGNRQPSPVSQPHLPEVADDNALVFHQPSELPDARTLIMRVPHVNSDQYLPLPNFREDMALREALLAVPTRWQRDSVTNTMYYRASNTLSIHYEGPQAVAGINSDSMLLTARILMGLWINRHADAQLSSHGRVPIKVEEILAWRGIQKHQRIAYAGASKRFSDGYQTKQKQQIHTEIRLLSHYTIHGQQHIRHQGQIYSNPLASSYLQVQQVEEHNKVIGYLVEPGKWINAYQNANTLFFASVERQIFQFHPRNDYLSLRLAFYLVEHWRQQARSGDYQRPIHMAQLLTSSMISVDKANLTTRFVPRIEAALQKLHAQHILGDPPICLSHIATNKAQWGNEWLASYWHLVPPSEIIQAYTSCKPVSVADPL
ncbi:hypothetical protein [Dictyobacter alpinus]|nr:hypothetical protein [Dictyobacter alpinus]